MGRLVTYAQIKLVVAQVFSVTMAELHSESREQNRVWARQLCFLAAKELTDLSYTRIGELTGGRNHATVMHGRQKALARRVSHPGYNSKADVVFLRLTEIARAAAEHQKVLESPPDD